MLAIGGCALGAELSFGGFAVSTIAVGGMAVGYFAIGGGAAGMHTVSGAGVDPEVGKLLNPVSLHWSHWGPMLGILCPTASLIFPIILLILFLTRTGTPVKTREPYNFSNERNIP